MGVKVRWFRQSWWVFIDHQGKRRAKKVGDKSTTERIAREIRERLVKSDLYLPLHVGDAITLAKYADAWLAQARLSLKRSTALFYEANLQRHVLPALGPRLVSDLRRADCRALVATCRLKGLKVTTVAGIARTLSTILTQAVEDELLPANPALRLGRHLRRADEPEREPDPFSRDDASALVEVCRARYPDWLPWLLTGLRTGLRLSELLALQWGDVNWRESFVVVRRSLVRGEMTTPKNHQRRSVDLSRQLRAELRLWRRRQRAAWLQHGQPFPEWLFPSVSGSALDEANARKAYYRVLDAAGLHRRGPHQMRHTFASLLLQQGAPITYVSQQLGHKDASITLRRVRSLVARRNWPESRGFTG